MNTLASALPAAGEVNLADGWDKFWIPFSNALPGLDTLLTVIGVGLVAFAIGSWLWERRRGGGMGGQGNSKLLWTGLAGAAFAAPTVIFPIGLMIIDAIINFVLEVLNLG